MLSVKKPLGAGRARGVRLLLAGAALALLAGCEGVGTPSSLQTATSAETNLDRYLKSAARSAEAAGDDQAATAHYRALADGQPGDKATTLALARSLGRSGGTAEAIDRVRTTLAASGPDADLLVELGKLYIADGRAAEALEPLEQAARLAPSATAPDHALAIANDRLGRYAAAAIHYDKALKRNPGDAALLNNYALSNALAGHLEQARALLNRAAALPGAPAQVRANLALLAQMEPGGATAGEGGGAP
jgi:Flp pilus assembly protein TadD